MSQKKTSVGNSSIGNMFGTFKKKLLGSNDKPKAKDVSKDATTKTPVGLFTPIKIGDIGVAKNRIALAPMTRDRATVDGVVGKYQAEFYAQRANAGLEITEGCQISAQGVGWWCAPSFFTKEQISAWKPVVQAVHDNNGLLVLQLWHLGRASHSDYFQELAKAANVEKILPVAPSEIAINGDGIYVPGWAKKPHEVPRALETDEIVGVIESFVAAAKAAIDEVGFDGVEIHGANGYLIDEFLQSKTNKREDKYGGSIENRVRFVDELLAAMVKEIPASKIGIRYSPNAVYNDTGSPDNLETFDKAIEVAASYNLAYIHVVDGLAFGFHNLSEAYTLKRAKDVIAKVQNGNVVTSLMGNCGYTKETAEEKIKAGDTDMISFGRDYISNPDLAIRFEKNLELAPPAEYKFYYIPNAEDPGVGYTDFPAAKKE